VADVFKELREFISRGNVVDLAVAVVIGAAFTAIVTSVVEGLITPLIGMIGGKDFRQMTFTVNDSVFSYGIVINAVIYFLTVSAVLFFLVVKPLNVLAERRRRGEEPVDESELSDEAVLLAEIRDLLSAQARRGGAAQPPTL
jgi:large conductance mechanosensitive channel